MSGLGDFVLGGGNVIYFILVIFLVFNFVRLLEVGEVRVGCVDVFYILSSFGIEFIVVI